MAPAPFADLAAGGHRLADALSGTIGDRQALVLGIVRGGVPAAYEVACHLDLPMDVVLLKGLVVRQSGVILRAASVAGATVLDDGGHALPAGTVERQVIDDGVAALVTRTEQCRGSRPVVDIAGRTVLLVDNGLRTGRTMAAAILAVRARGAGRVIAAAAAGTPAAVEMVGDLAADLRCLVTSPALGNVAMAYRRFDVPGEGRIRALVDTAAAARSRLRACATSDGHGSRIADL